MHRILTLLRYAGFSTTEVKRILNIVMLANHLGLIELHKDLTRDNAIIKKMSVILSTEEFGDNYGEWKKREKSSLKKCDSTIKDIKH